MKRTITVLTCLLLGQAALAALSLERISCKGKNGVVIKGVVDSKYVRTEWGGHTKDFELVKRPVVVTKDYYKVSLGMVGAPKVNVYDMYLWGDLTRGEVSYLDGLIGTDYGTYAPQTYPSPVELPLTFIAVTPVKCTLVAR